MSSSTYVAGDALFEKWSQHVALTRSKDSAGRSSYDGKHLGMASFRESSELEYGCDDAFLLFPLGGDDEDGHDGSVRPSMLAHVKSRDGEPKSIALKFHRRIQRFTADDETVTSIPSVAASVNQVWQGGSGANDQQAE